MIMNILKTNFIFTNQSSKGTSLTTVLEGVTSKDILNMFGKLPKYYESKHKYSESIVLQHKNEKLTLPTGFIGKNGAGIYTVYARFGEWRIGGFSKNQNTEELKNLIMGGWSKSQGKINNQNLKSQEMDKTEEKAPKKLIVKKGTKTEIKAPIVAKTPVKTEKKAPVKKAEKVTASKQKKETTKKASKKSPGVIASILEFVEKGPIKESDIVKKLSKRFPEKESSSMAKTVKAQIGSNKRPVRMEREKGIEFSISVNEKTKEKTYSIKK